MTQHGPYVLARDISIGSIIESSVCVDARGCNSDPSLVFDLGQNANTDKKTLIHRYPSSGQYFMDIHVKDDLGQEASRKYPLSVNTTGAVDFFYPLTIPEIQSQGNNYAITVGDQLDNTVSYILQYAGSGDCYMDTNIAIDTNGDTITDNDDDVRCNELISITYEPVQASLPARVYYDRGSEQITHDVTINFVDITNTLTPDQQVIYTKLWTIINKIPSDSGQDRYLRELLVKLQAALDDRDVRGGLILDIESAIDVGGLTLADAQKNQIIAILNTMKDDALIAASGGSAYDQSKAEIMLLAWEVLWSTISSHFTAIETSTADTPDAIKEELHQILQKMTASVGQEGGIDETDVNVILLPNICRIMEYYDIVSETCQTYATSAGLTDDAPAIPSDESSARWTSWMSGILKRVLIIAGVLLLAFGGLVWFFVLKAKRAQSWSAE